MTLRTRLLWSFAAVAIVPLSLLAFGVRQEMTARLSDLHHTRLETVVDVVHEDLQRESASIAARLMSLKGAILKDNRFRSGAVAGLESDATYVRDYAETAMRLTGLSMLQIQDDEGRIAGEVLHLLGVILQLIEFLGGARAEDQLRSFFPTGIVPVLVKPCLGGSGIHVGIGDAGLMHQLPERRRRARFAWWMEIARG